MIRLPGHLLCPAPSPPRRPPLFYSTPLFSIPPPYKRGGTLGSLSPATFANGASLHIQEMRCLPQWRVFVLLRRCLQVANFVELRTGEVRRILLTTHFGE